MNVKVPTIMSVEEVPPGALFYHLDAGPNVLCISGRFASEQGDDDPTLVIPLRYDSSPESVGVGIYANQFSGFALIVDDGLARLDPASTAREGMGSGIFASDGGLYFPVTRGRGFRMGFLNLETGEIRQHIPDLTGFEHWEIVDSNDPEKLIWSSKGQPDD